MRILRTYAYKGTVPVKELAVIFKVKKATIATHKNRIKQKAEALFKQPFNHVKVVATYLHRQGLI